MFWRIAVLIIIIVFLGLTNAESDEAMVLEPSKPVDAASFDERNVEEVR